MFWRKKAWEHEEEKNKAKKKLMEEISFSVKEELMTREWRKLKEEQEKRREGQKTCVDCLFFRYTKSFCLGNYGLNDGHFGECLYSPRIEPLYKSVNDYCSHLVPEKEKK